MNERFAGVDVGGTNIALAIGNVATGIEFTETMPTLGHEGPDRVLARISKWIQAHGEVDSIGLGLPGTLDRGLGVVEFLPNFPGNWRGVAAARTLSAQVNAPVYLLNDARMATLGELRFGVGKDKPGMTLVCFTLGTGIGGGVAVEGKLRLGAIGAAGEVGHQTILPDGPRCGCGNHGCLETLAAAPAITGEAARLLRSGLAPTLHEIVRGDLGKLTPKEVGEASQHDVALREMLERVAGYLAIAIANTIHLLHPEAVVLGGGVAAMGEPLLAPLRAQVPRRVRMFSSEDVWIGPSPLGERAGMLGGIALAEARGEI